MNIKRYLEKSGRNILDEEDLVPHEARLVYDINALLKGLPILRTLRKLTGGFNEATLARKIARLAIRYTNAAIDARLPMRPDLTKLERGR